MRVRGFRTLATGAALATTLVFGCASQSEPDPEQSSPITQGEDCEGAESSYDESQRALATCRIGASESACAGLTGTDCTSCVDARCRDEASSAQAAAETEARCTDGGTPLQVHALFECAPGDAGTTR